MAGWQDWHTPPSLVGRNRSQTMSVDRRSEAEWRSKREGGDGRDTMGGSLGRRGHRRNHTSDDNMGRSMKAIKRELQAKPRRLAVAPLV